jgi:hypothetical protein
MQLNLSNTGGHLYCWIFRNEYFTRGNQIYSEFRGVPLVDSENLLAFLDMSEVSARGMTSCKFPYPIPSMSDAIMSVDPEPEDNSRGDFDVQTPDFVLAAGNCRCDRAYRVYIGCMQNPQFMSILFRSPQSNKRFAASVGAGPDDSGRVNWAAMMVTKPPANEEEGEASD